MKVKTLSNLERTYLASGIPKSDGTGFHEKSLVLIPNRFFITWNGKAETLVGTDTRGMICSFDSKGSALNPRQRFQGMSMKLVPIPTGLVRLAYLAKGKTWQEALIAEVRKVALGKHINAVSQWVTADMLQEPKLFGSFNSSVATLPNTAPSLVLVLPRMQALYFHFPSGFLKAQPDPAISKLQCVFPGGTGEISIFEIDADPPALNSNGEPIREAMGSLYRFDRPLQDGVYILNIPYGRIEKSAFSGSGFYSEHMDFILSFHVEWVTLNPFFEEHHLWVSPVTLESVLVEAYPEAFVHLANKKEENSFGNGNSRRGEAGVLDSLASLGLESREFLG